jgi:hypothetical protein
LATLIQNLFVLAVASVDEAIFFLTIVGEPEFKKRQTALGTEVTATKFEWPKA